MGRNRIKMKFYIASIVLFVQELVNGQQAGYLEQEGNPTMTLKECTIEGGCTSRQAKLTLDANWRWIHATSGYENCYSGDSWSSQYCSDPNQCAQNCALEGVSSEKYENTYGIEQIQDGVKLNFVTEHEYGVNVGSRLYSIEDDENYKLFYLKNHEFSYEVDVSELQCAINRAMYFVEMSENGGKGMGNNNAGAKYGTGYCDAQCFHDIKFIDSEANVIDWSSNPNDKSNNMGSGKYGSCCAEMDIWEANSMATAYTLHICGIESLLKCEGIECGDNDKGKRYKGVCDKDGCDINPYRMGNTDFYGRGSQYPVNILKPMTVVTQFLTTDGMDNSDLSEIQCFYVQDGKVIHSPSSTIPGPNDTNEITDRFCEAKKDLFGDVNHFQQLGGMKAMGESLDRGHVMIFSLWDDVEVNMLWLDSAFPLDMPETDPGVQRGDCVGGESSTPTYLRENYPNGYVSFTNAAIGEIGSTVPGITATKAPTKAPTKSPTAFPNGCYSINNKDCIHPGFDASSCTKTWLPNGARNDCVVLGGECTSNQSSCCQPAQCVGDNNYASCLPLPEATSDPTKAPTPSPSCTVCDDKPTKGMKKKEKTCADSNLKKKCNKSAAWIKKGYCQLSATMKASATKEIYAVLTHHRGTVLFYSYKIHII